MSDWKNAYRSFYYATADVPGDPSLPPAETALLVNDIQNTCTETPDDPAEAERWGPFFRRMTDTVIPNTVALIDLCRARNVEVIFSSTVRSLADESFNVLVVEDCCAAATMDLHRYELEIINMIYCHVVQSEEFSGFIS